MTTVSIFHAPAVAGKSDTTISQSSDKETLRPPSCEMRNREEEVWKSNERGNVIRFYLYKRGSNSPIKNRRPVRSCKEKKRETCFFLLGRLFFRICFFLLALFAAGPTSTMEQTRYHTQQQLSRRPSRLNALGPFIDWTLDYLFRSSITSQ